MSFICKSCNYKTDKKGNINRHYKSKRHLRNTVTVIPEISEQKTTISESDEVDYNLENKSARISENQRKVKKSCKFCGISFTTMSNYNRHLKNCEERKTVQENEKLKAQLLEQKKEIQNQKKQLKEYKVEKEYYRELINNYSKLGPRTFNSITYVMNKYANAPHIERIEPEKIEYFQDINMTKVENMVSDYRNDRFVTFIINTIISLQKKENPEDQSIWSTDSSRYNYLIKELLENEGSYWVIDKKGTKSQDYLIEPILKFIRKEIVKYNELASDALMNENLPKSRFSIITDTQRYGIDIIKDIDDGNLSADIIRKMAKHFHHKSKNNNNPLIEEVE